MHRGHRILLTTTLVTIATARRQPVVALDPPTPLTDGAVKFWEAVATVA